MSQRKLNYHQSGVALILSLLLLFVLTLIGVASFSSSHVQERAASNAIMQTKAFEAAAAGASHSVEFYMTNATDAPDLLCGANNHEGWYTTDNPPVPIATDWVDNDTYSVGNVNLRQRMYCLVDQYECDTAEVGCDDGTVSAPRSQLFVVSRGEVELGANGVVAFREIEVRIDRRNNIWTAEGCGALCFSGCEYKTDDRGDPRIDFPSSNVFQVDGGDEGGPAVTTSPECPNEPDLMGEIMGDIKNSRLGNYVGGLHEQDPGEPWNDPAKTEIFRDAVMDAAQNIDGNLYIDGINGNGPGTFADGVYEDNGNSEYGSLPGNAMITYVAGDLEMGGGISGAGIMMVEGDIFWNGTPDYKGLIVSLGGSYTIDGGGTGGDHAGSVVILNTDKGSPFGPISFENTGGGTAEYNYDCGVLAAAFESVPGYESAGDWSDADNPWGFDKECKRGPPTLYEAPGDLMIVSWRENIGWREETIFAGVP